MIREVTLPWDLQEINEWLADRDEDPFQLELLPPDGLIEPGVAAGFLISTNAGLSFLEYFVSNKRADKKVRSLTLDEIASQLIAAANASGSRAIFAMSKHNSIKALCTKHGLRPIDTEVFGRMS